MKVLGLIAILFAFASCRKDNSTDAPRLFVNNDGKVVEVEEGESGGGVDNPESKTGNKTGKTSTGETCEYAKVYDVAYPDASYTRVIGIFLKQKCAVCHRDNKAGGASAGISLVNYDKMYNYRDKVVGKVLGNHKVGSNNNNTETAYNAEIQDLFSKWKNQNYVRNPKGEVYVGTKCDK